MLLAKYQALALVTVLTSVACQAPAQPNLILVTIDTLRADRIGTYGYAWPTTPNIDQFAEDALVFERAVAPMPTTLPSHVSMMTGVYPVRHGIVSNFRFLGRKVQTDRDLKLLAQVLQDSGYSTAAFTSSSPLSAATGIDQGFDVFHGPPEYATERRRIDVPAEETVTRALQWLDNASSPFFLWVHLFDPHDPYSAPPPYGEKFRGRPLDRAGLREVAVPMNRIMQAHHDSIAYDGEVSYADSQVGRLLKRLKQLGHYEDAILVVVGDHGEGLWQHGHSRHVETWNEQLLVPLIIRLPDGARGRRPQLVSLVDILPTLAAHTDLPIHSSQLDGIDVITSMRKSALSQRWVRLENPTLNFTLTTDEWKYWLVSDGNDRLYFLPTDPHETRNVHAAHPKVAADLREEVLSLVQESRAQAPLPVEESIPDSVRRQLESLGYVE